MCTVMAISSISSMASEKETMLISPVPTSEQPIIGTPQITINGESVDLSKYNLSQYIYESNENIMVPLRAVAEKMGYAVNWDNDSKAFTAENDNWKVTAYIDEDLYYGVTKIKDAVGMTAPQNYGTAPQLVDNSTYVPAKMFELMGYNYDSIGQFVNFTDNSADNNVQMPNPFIIYDNLDAAKKALSFNPLVPSDAPTGYSIREISAIGNDFLQIIYGNDNQDKTIYYRTAKGNEDISGDYNIYSNTKTITVNGNNITIKGNNNLYNNATWYDTNHAFSIYSNDGISKETMENIIKSIN